MAETAKKMEQAECSTKCRSKKDASKLINVICRSGDLESLLFIASTGICNNAGKVTDAMGRTALHLAASVGKVNVLDWLVHFKNAQVNAKDVESGYSALHRSVFHGQLHVAKSLVCNHSANLSLQDFDGLTPLDHLSLDRSFLRHSYGHHFKRNSEIDAKYDAYVWGANSNYTLGLGAEQAKDTPEIHDFLRREKLKIKQVCISKFHSAFLTSDGLVYTCGHGRGGRLGHSNSNEFILTPKLVKNLNDVTYISLGIDHSLFMTSSGQVFACGMNTFGQVGIGSNRTEEEINVPLVLNGSKSKLPSASGIAASKFHSVYWTKDDCLYTWGLNAGQLGQGKFDQIISSPKLVSSLKSGARILQLASSDGALIVLTSNGDLLALNEYQTRKIGSKLNNIIKMEAIGGHLDPKALKPTHHGSLLVDKGGQDLKVFLLNAIGKISVWQEKAPNIVHCIVNISREFTDFALHRHGLLLITREGAAYTGTHQTRAVNSGSKTPETNGELFKFVEKDQCDSLKVKRLPFVHRGKKAFVDPKGHNFCILQIHPGLDVCDLPVVEKPTLLKDMQDLFNDETLKDLDVIIDGQGQQGQSRIFKCHKYILAAHSTKLEELVRQMQPNQNTLDLTSYFGGLQEGQVLLQFLQYAYYQTCDIFKTTESSLPFKMQPLEKDGHRSFHAKDLAKAAHSIYNQEKLSKKNKKTENGNNPVVVLQNVARSLGMHEMSKNLEHYTYNSATNGLKLKAAEKTILPARIKVFPRTTLSWLSDVIIVSADGEEFAAHKCILSARLDYFRSMFSMGWMESTCEMTKVNLPLVGKLVHILLDYLYTDFDTVNTADPEFLCQVLVMADQLLIPRLLSICEQQLASLLTLKNVGEILQLSADFNAAQLQNCCMNFMCNNFAALLESKNQLEVVDMELLEQVSKHYQKLNKIVGSRTVTPPQDSDVKTEDIEAHAAGLEMTLEDLIEYESELPKLVNIGSSKKKRTRRVSNESTGSSDGSCDMNVSKTSVDSVLDDFEHLQVAETKELEESSFTLCSSKSSNKKAAVESDDVIKSFFRDPKQFSAVSSSPTSSELGYLGKFPTCEEALALSAKKFSKRAEERKRQLYKEEQTNNNCEKSYKWTGWGHNDTTSPVNNAGHNGTSDSSLALIMKAEEAVKMAGKTPPLAGNKPNNVPKRVRKQSWKSLSFEDSPKSVISSVAPVTNPWKVLPANEKASPDVEAILKEESVQSENLNRAKSQPFHVTQMEEKAMSELKTFYNADNVFDESITIERVEKAVLATPIWKRSNSATNNTKKLY